MELSTAIIIVLVIVIIIFIAWMAKRMPIWGSKNLTYYQKCARDTFQILGGEAWSDNNQHTIDYMTTVSEEDKNAYDYFLTGATYMYGRRSPDRIVENYGRALDEIKAGNVHEDERDFILGRIRDHVFYNPEEYAERNLAALQEPVMTIYQRMLDNELADAIKVSLEPLKADHKKPAKTKAEKIERKAPVIRSDSQNVHDAAVTLEFSKQYKRLRIYNDDDQEDRNRILTDSINDTKVALSAIDVDREKRLNQEAISAFLLWLKDNIKDKQRLDDLNRRFVNEYDMTDRSEGGAKIRERDVIAHTWRRIHSNQNKDKVDDMLEALKLRLETCFEGGKPVCVTGRSEQIMSSLATLDKDSNMGTFTTSELIKGQMYTIGATIVDKAIRALPPNIRDSYNASTTKKTLSPEDLQKLSEAISSIHSSVETELHSKFDTKLPDEDINNVIKTINKEVSLE